MSRLRHLPSHFLALLAALCLLIAQVGAIEHGWTHTLEPHGTHEQAHAQGHADDDAHSFAEHADGSAFALCDLCAHYAAVVQVPATAAGTTFVPADAGFAQPLVHASPPAARGTVHYAARAPPVSLI